MSERRQTRRAITDEDYEEYYALYPHLKLLDKYELGKAPSAERREDVAAFAERMSS